MANGARRSSGSGLVIALAIPAVVGLGLYLRRDGDVAACAVTVPAEGGVRARGARRRPRSADGRVSCVDRGDRRVTRIEGRLGAGEMMSVEVDPQDPGRVWRTGTGPMTEEEAAAAVVRLPVLGGLAAAGVRARFRRLQGKPPTWCCRPTVEATRTRPQGHDAPMSRRGWVLFGAMSVIWGVPYLLISIAVESLTPAAVVAGRTGLAALLLLPLAVHQGSLRIALRAWPWILAFATIEMAIPFVLLGHAEQTLPSGLTGLLVATVPLFGAVVSYLLGDHHALTRSRVTGLVVGVGGVALVVGAASGSGEIRLLNVAEVLVVAVCYATAPFITARKLTEVPGIGLAALALAMVAVAYIPPAVLTQDEAPTARSLGALVGLAVLCTAIAFVLFFALIREVGPARATVITFVNPVVALALGVVVLDEHLSWGQLAGLPVVLVGCWLAAGRRPADPDPDPGTPALATVPAD